MPPSSVELHPAFTWNCDHCGRDNFERGLVFAPDALGRVALTAEEAATAEVMLAGGPDLVRGHFTKGPDRVACGHCGGRFDTKPYGT